METRNTRVKFLRVHEAAELLGVNRASVRQLEQRGLLRAVRDWNGHRRFSQDEVEDLYQRLLAGELSEHQKEKPWLRRPKKTRIIPGART